MRILIRKQLHLMVARVNPINIVELHLMVAIMVTIGATQMRIVVYTVMFMVGGTNACISIALNQTIQD